MPTLPGEHLCSDHQGNTSHYAKHNCRICQQQSELASLKAKLEEAEAYNGTLKAITVTLDREIADLKRHCEAWKGRADLLNEHNQRWVEKLRETDLERKILRASLATAQAALGARIQNRKPLDYLELQFPATEGHIPLIEYFGILDSALATLQTPSQGKGEV